MNDFIIGWGLIAGFGELGYEGYTWLVDGKSTNQYIVLDT